MNHSGAIEAILFYRGEPVRIKELVASLGLSTQAVEEALLKLEKELEGRGLSLMRQGDEVMLATSAEHSKIIEKMLKTELEKDLGKAGLETLSIILYMGPISRSRVDYIRGVNSTFIIRNLMIRGLVERVDNPDDQRSFLYKPTFDLLSYLGVAKEVDLPEYALVRDELARFELSKQEADGNRNTTSPEPEEPQA